MIRTLLVVVVLMMPTLSYADSLKDDAVPGKSEIGTQREKNIIKRALFGGYWKKEDCKKVSDGVGALLYFSGELLKASDKERKTGEDKKADKIFEKAYALSDIAANFAKSFKIFCRRN